MAYQSPCFSFSPCGCKKGCADDCACVPKVGEVGQHLVLGADGNPEWMTVGGGTDSQTLSITGNELTISNGNTVTLPIGGGTDSQTLTLTGNDLSISNGNTVTLPGENQTLTKVQEQVGSTASFLEGLKISDPDNPAVDTTVWTKLYATFNGDGSTTSWTFDISQLANGSTSIAEVQVYELGADGVTYTLVQADVSQVVNTADFTTDSVTVSLVPAPASGSTYVAIIQSI